jgi:hypothetical protein
MFSEGKFNNTQSYRSMRGDLWMDDDSKDKDKAPPMSMAYRSIGQYHNQLKLSRAIESKHNNKAESYMPKPHEVSKSGYLQIKGKKFGCQKLLY